MDGDIATAQPGPDYSGREARTGWRKWLRAGKGLLGMGWFQLEGTLLLVALCVSIFFLAVGTRVNVPATLLFTFVVGNWTAVLVSLGAPFFHRRRPPWNFFAYVIMLAVIGISGSFFADVIVSLIFFGPHLPSLMRLHLQSNELLGTLVTLIFGVLVFVFAEQKSTMEKRNRELQSQVHLGRMEQQSHEAELTQAHEIQRHLMPRETPQAPGYQIACAWQPAKTVSGDYFDVLPLSDGRIGLCIADVAGKGITAALLMANLQASVKAFASDAEGPAALCLKLNRVLCDTVAPGKFVTLFYGILSSGAQDSQQRWLRYENAGHCLPLLVHIDGRISLPASYSGVLGLFSHWTYQDNELALESGDCLLLVTDGVLEATNQQQEEFGYQRLIVAVQRNRSLGVNGIRKAILDEVSEFCSGQFQDDASLIVVTVD